MTVCRHRAGVQEFIEPDGPPTQASKDGETGDAGDMVEDPAESNGGEGNGGEDSDGDEDIDDDDEMVDETLTSDPTGKANGV